MKEEKTRKELEEHITFLEKELKALKDLPFLRINPKDNTQQKTTPASKLYKELLQQYINLGKAYEVITKDENKEKKTSLDIPPAFAKFLTCENKREAH